MPWYQLPLFVDTYEKREKRSSSNEGTYQRFSELFTRILSLFLYYYHILIQFSDFMPLLNSV